MILTQEIFGPESASFDSDIILLDVNVQAVSCIILYTT